MSNRSGKVVEPRIRLKDAGQIVEAINQVSEQFLPRKEKLRWLMQRLGPLIGENIDFHMLLFDELDRNPVPRCIDRVTFGPTFDLIEPRSESEVQRLMDLCSPICEPSISAALSRLRSPNTYIYSTDSDEQWFTDTFKPHLLDPNNWEDCMACYWAGSKDRLIIYNAFRWRGSRAFTEDQRNVLSLIARAVAPIMDVELFSDMSEDLDQLDRSLRAVLVPVLQGLSDREIAELAGSLSDQVDIAVKKLFNVFNVQTRGELIAQFVDQRTLRWLAQTSGLTV
jgi:hypothetical protein